MLNWVGFNSFGEFAFSLLKPKLFAKVMPILFVMAPLFAFIEQTIGLGRPLFLSFLALNIIEFYTGVAASKAEGKDMSSVKMHRFLIKTVVYLAILGVIWQNSHHAGGNIGSDTALVVYRAVYWLVFNYISLILTRSVFENLHRMGVKEAAIIYGLLNNKVTRFVAYIVAPPDPEKRER